MAAPLHQLTNKATPFVWNEACQSAFVQLKEKLTQAPVLTYPCFDLSANQFSLQTDASATGIGAVLEQGRHVVAYASRTLSPAEKNYSVIQRECLAIIFGLKQFRHYLLGCKFSLLTDHAPYSGSQARKWKACWLDGHWQLKNMTLPSHTVKAQKTAMQTPCLDKPSNAIEGVSKEKIGVPLPISLEVPLLAIVQIRAKNNVP